MRRFLLASLLSCSFLAAPALGQEAGQVSGSGSVEIKRPAEFLRMQVELTAKGKDLKEALTKFKERREAVAAQLAALGVAKSDVHFGETAVTSAMTDRQRQMEMMVMQRRGGRKPDPKNKQPDPVVVGATLKADLPVRGGSAEELLLTSHALQEKIKAADLGGLKDPEKLSAKEEELAEEMQEMGRMMQEAGQSRPGEPTFLYVCKIPAAERDKALKEAYKKAADQAARLAQAAGAELGPLASLSSHSQVDANDATSEMNPYYTRAVRAFMSRGAEGGGEDDPDEAVGPTPGKVSLRVTVNAAFQIKKK